MPTNDFTSQGILARFTSVELPESAVITATLIEPRIRDAAEAIVDNLPTSREASLALTALEEAKMWALRAAALAAAAETGDELQPLSARLQEKGA